MSKDHSEARSTNDEEPVNGFLNCIAYLMAKRWLKDQRSLDEESLKREETLKPNENQE